MHLGNVFAALMSYLSVKSQGGAWILRMEDLDTQRTKPEYAQTLREDLTWLGLHWDEETPAQSGRNEIYDHHFHQLLEEGRLYPCYCTRNQLHSVNAPHLSDGTPRYPGTCRNLTPAQCLAQTRSPAWRLRVPDREIALTDLVQGPYRENLSRDCGDFVLRRSDGMYVYQLAVTVDDGLSGVTEVVRGWDLLSSTPRQLYLQELFGFSHPTYAHIPLLMSPDGRRLSKRDRDLDLGVLRQSVSPETIVGVLAHAAGLTDTPQPITPQELTKEFSWDKVQGQQIVVTDLNTLSRP